MCVGPFAPKSSSTPAPPPLPAPPPPPPQPLAPVIQPSPLIEDVNPQVRRARSKKAKSGDAMGTGSLRIKLAPNVNTGAVAPDTSGMNK